jgi:hypothetical protein
MEGAKRTAIINSVIETIRKEGSSDIFTEISFRLRNADKPHGFGKPVRFAKA